MSKLSNAVAKQHEANTLRLDETVTNFMGGDSYTINPLDTLKMVTASSIFGEPAYYRGGRSSKAGIYRVHPLVKDFTLLDTRYEGKNTETIMEQIIDAALDYDFAGTLEWAKTLRSEFYMRLNPQVIMTRAAVHPGRKAFTEKNPGVFNDINQQVMRRADEPMSQMAYYLYSHGGKKNNIPSVLKRSWAIAMSGLDAYKVNKYKNAEIGMINAVRLCHAHSKVIDELMRTGTVEVGTEDKTWEQYRSDGKDWRWILDNCNMGHMALLRNLRGVFTEVNDAELCKQYLDRLKVGVKGGKQFPFRYYSAIRAVESSSCNHKPMIIDALEECMDIALDNFPKLKGKTMCLSDNSGSAWGCFNSEYGSVTVAEIDNLSSVITSACSDEGYVGEFGDRLRVTPISKRRGVLSQAQKMSADHGSYVGGSTEGGIWVFFRDAIEKKEHFDNIFIYSDQQAGHGGLYGTGKHQQEYGRMGFGCGSSWYGEGGMINVFKLIQEYRKKVNPKVNVFSIQTAGYDNVLIPEMAYRTAILYGWTGREAEFAQKYINLWDQVEGRNQK